MYKVSVLVPIYGVEKYIEKCARSLFMQTCSEIEYIFVDDCTPDNSIGILKNVVEEFPERKDSIKIIKHDKNRGLAAARKTATLNATSEFIVHIDSDDFIAENAVQAMLDKAKETNADMVICNMELVYNNGRRLFWENNYHSNKNEYIKSLLKHKSLTCLAGRLLRRTIVVEHNLFTREGLNQGEDYVIVPIISYYCGRIEKVDTKAPLYYYVKYNEESYTSKINLEAINNNVEANDYLSNFFLSLKEKSEFEETIRMSKLYNKLTLISASDKSLYPIIRTLYSDISYFHTELEFKFKILLLLIDFKLYALSYMLVNIFRKKGK